jgi:hypothetical protein
MLALTNREAPIPMTKLRPDVFNQIWFDAGVTEREREPQFQVYA